MINNRAMPVLLSARRVATHHRSSTPTINDFAGALGPSWIATPSMLGALIPFLPPVYPGAPKVLIKQNASGGPLLWDGFGQRSADGGGSPVGVGIPSRRRQRRSRPGASGLGRSLRAGAPLGPLPAGGLRMASASKSSVGLSNGRTDNSPTPSTRGERRISPVSAAPVAKDSTWLRI
jgi:hypothetical protein